MKRGTITLSDYLESLQSRGQYTFRRKEAMGTLQMTDNAFKKAAHRLVTKSRIKRIRSDFYTIIPIEYKVSGSLPASWFIDSFMKHVEQPYYCGLLTAAALQGAAHQQPMVFQVVTTKQIRPIEVGQLRIEFICKKTIKTHFYQPLKTVTGHMNVSTPEMTAFDLVRYMRVAGHIHHIATVLCELVVKLNPQGLAALVIEDDAPVIVGQRLGYLLDKLELSIDLEPLEQALKQKKMNQRLLTPDGDQLILEKNQRWRILVNEHLEPDEL